jgi:hypothetical protein
MNEYPYREAETLARKIRPLISHSGPVLFHGTRAPCTIAMQNVLRCPPHSAISFTRFLHIAAHFAVLPRCGQDEQLGAILILDRTKLAQRYKLECYRDEVFHDAFPELAERKTAEAEERVVGRDIDDLNRYIVDIIWLDPVKESRLAPMPVAQELMTWAHHRLLKKTVRTHPQRTFKQRMARRDHELALRKPILIRQTI